MFDWDAAEELLYTISKEQVARFLGRGDCGDLYGIGFFCDPIEGVMLVANTRRYLAASPREYVERFDATGEEASRWDIGNWEYPAGLALSTEEQMEFDAAWERLGRPQVEDDEDRAQVALEELCARVLRRLCNEKVFSDAHSLEGSVVLGPDDPPGDLLIKKRRLDSILNRRS